VTLARKIIAIVVMVVSVIGLIASLVAVVGVRTAKAHLAAEAQAALDGLGGDLETASGALAEIDPALNMSRVILEEISATAGGAGDKLGEPKAVELAQTVRNKLSEIEGKVQDANGRLGQVELRINGLLTTVNKLPGVQVPPLDVRVLDDLGGLLSDANSGLRDLADTVTGGKTSMVGEMQTIEQAVAGLQGDLSALGESAVRAQGGISSAKAVLTGWQSLIPGWLHHGATFLTVALIWFALGQVGLFMWMLSVYRSAQRSD
jgi:hypothetical protein